MGGGGEGTIPLPGTSAYKAWLRNGNRNAYGLDRVPFDDYPALLHEGERVLTAGEARAMDEGGGGTVVQVTVTGNNFMGTGEEMADQIAEILVRKLERADTAAGR